MSLVADEWVGWFVFVSVVLESTQVDLLSDIPSTRFTPPL